jgi:hypothetical protein
MGAERVAEALQSPNKSGRFVSSSSALQTSHINKRRFASATNVFGHRCCYNCTLDTACGPLDQHVQQFERLGRQTSFRVVSKNLPAIGGSNVKPLRSLMMQPSENLANP